MGTYKSLHRSRVGDTVWAIPIYYVIIIVVVVVVIIFIIIIKTTIILIMIIKVIVIIRVSNISPADNTLYLYASCGTQFRGIRCPAIFDFTFSYNLRILLIFARGIWSSNIYWILYISIQTHTLAAACIFDVKLEYSRVTYDRHIIIYIISMCGIAAVHNIMEYNIFIHNFFFHKSFRISFATGLNEYLL